MMERRRILVAVRVNEREHRRWQLAAELEDLRLPELLREAMRTHIRDLVRLQLLTRPVPKPEEPDVVGMEPTRAKTGV